MATTSKAHSGLPVDTSGDRIIIDPTKNVLDLVRAAVERLDDISSAKSRRLDDLRDAEARRIDEITKLRAAHHEKMAAAESRRLDAVRQVDVLNQSVAADRALTAIQTLAATTKADAEALRQVVATTAATLTASNSSLMATVNERLAALERSMYEGKGKGSGYSAMWGWIAGGVILLIAILKYLNP